MLTDGGYLNSKELGHGLLRKPDRFVFKENLNIHLAVAGGVEEEVRLFGGEIVFQCRLLLSALTADSVKDVIIPLVNLQGGLCPQPNYTSPPAV